MAPHHIDIVLLATMLITAEGKMLPDFKNSKDCRVGSLSNVPSPFNEKYLFYITIQSPFTLGIKFKNEKHMYTRDAFIFKNDKIEHSEIRDGETQSYVQDLPILLSEGWSFIIVAINDKYLTITLVKPEGYVSLYTKHLDYDVKEMLLDGKFMPCSEAPVFDVPEGGEVPVLLWLDGSEQLLELTAGNSTDLYFKFPGEAKNYSVPSNCTLLVSTSFQGNQTMLKVLKKDEGDRKEIGRSTVPINTDMSLIFGGGPAQLRLTKVSECCNSSLAAPVATQSAGPPRLSTVVFDVVCVIVVIAGVVTCGILRKRELKKILSKSSSDDIEANDADKNEQMPLMVQNNNGLTKKFTGLVSRNDVSRFVATLNKHCRDAATIDVLTTTMNNGHEESQQLRCTSDNLRNIKEAVMNQIKNLHNDGPALIDFMGTMEQKKWQALLQSLKDDNLQLRELAITS